MSIKNVQTLYKAIASELNSTSLNDSCLTPSKRSTKESLAKAAELKITSEKNFM